MNNKIDISIDMAPKKEKIISLNSEKTDLFKIDYIMNKNSQHTQIKPIMGYLEQINLNKEISAINIDKYLFSPNPTIFIKITNNKNTTLKIDKIQFNVIYSKPVKKPLPVFRYLSGGKPFEVFIENKGWEKMINTSIKFDFYLNKDDENSLSLDNEKFTMNIGSIDEIKSIDVSNIFKDKWKFNIEYLSSTKMLTSFSDFKHTNPLDKSGKEFRDAFLEKLFIAYGDLKNILFRGQEFRLILYMRGQIYYQYKHNNEIYDAKPIDFIAPIKLFKKAAAGPLQPFEAIYTVQLEVDKKDYSLIIDDSYAIKQGNTEVIQISFSSQQSSIHKINIIAKTNQGELKISNDILLEILKFKDNKA